MDSANIFLTSIKHKIPSNAGSALQPILEQAGEQSLHKLMLLNLRNPTVGLFISGLFGTLGVDRFYKGDIKLGITKLALWILTYVMLISAFLITISGVTPTNNWSLMATLHESLFYRIGVISLITYNVWWMIDIYLVFVGIKNDNLNKIYQALQ